MGEEVDQQDFSRADRTRHREKVRRNLDVFARMLREARFDTDDPMTGLEMELNLIDEVGDPALKNAEVLEAIADPDFQTELGQFNIEINLAPAKLREGGLTTFEESLRRSLNDAEEKAAKVGAHQVMIGILPTLAEGHMDPSSLSANPRYKLLSEQILAARGEDITISISGRERLTTTADSIVPEAACTSTQFHVQTSPDQFAAYWNAAQAVAGVQLAVSANSPFLLGRELWRETRIPLFEQATDTRSEELKAQGVRPRVWFGERWITSVFDLFEENVRYFPALLPVTDEEDPLEVLEAGGTPALHELKLHNGTIYRWNRPVYDVADDMPHLRVENRLLAAGPTVADTIANAALWFGLIRYLAESERPLWSQMSFSAAEENFHVAAQTGVDAQVYWPGIGQVRATELVLRRLLPMARAGLDSWGVPGEESDRYLGIIEQRCQAETSGAAWFVERVRERGGEDRFDALRATLLDYRDRMHSNEPVHLWD
ncbi:glutamate-cysteine ligase family protein [Nocardioides KLBMP 9356]|uniref:Glutamate-cysteine ligase family protein n=1 Tax=Nocardioides potassii TaxID=2911371 RepID=A0ABS9H8M9_9ACTN|nr:glutamate-cysteine ligase family protein [Nocardioides potassii]MCF6377582.1 glutamate-cysteine ligase family protein [Nocardioides potassii]